MEHEPDTTMKWRLLMARAALDVARRDGPGKADSAIVMSDIPDGGRRYLFAVPSGEPGGNDFSCDDLAGKLRDEKVPHSLDLDPESSYFGVRYVAKSTSLPPAIKRFASQDASNAWSGWREKCRAERDAVTKSARELVEGAPWRGEPGAERRRSAPRPGRQDRDEGLR